jgi:hypothetical protein
MAMVQMPVIVVSMCMNMHGPVFTSFSVAGR